MQIKWVILRGFLYNSAWFSLCNFLWPLIGLLVLFLTFWGCRCCRWAQARRLLRKTPPPTWVHHSMLTSWKSSSFLVDIQAGKIWRVLWYSEFVIQILCRSSFLFQSHPGSRHVVGVRFLDDPRALWRLWSQRGLLLKVVQIWSVERWGWRKLAFWRPRTLKKCYWIKFWMPFFKIYFPIWWSKFFGIGWTLLILMTLLPLRDERINIPNSSFVMQGVGISAFWKKTCLF